PMTIRYFIEQFQYRSPIDFNEDGLKLAEKQYEKLNEFVLQVREKTSQTLEVKDKELKEIWDNIISALDEDMNTPVVFAELLKLVKIAGKNIKTANESYLAELNQLITILIEQVLGFTFDSGSKNKEENSIPSKILDLAEQRVEAKKNKNFALADEIRKKIEDSGYSLKDTREGYEITKM
ncbi:MAG: DALR domain-containing protein, partial [Clostridia bacterium]